jgi:hypothetical protein
MPVRPASSTGVILVIAAEKHKQAVLWSSVVGSELVLVVDVAGAGAAGGLKLWPKAEGAGSILPNAIPRGLIGLVGVKLPLRLSNINRIRSRSLTPNPFKT